MALRPIHSTVSVGIVQEDILSIGTPIPIQVFELNDDQKLELGSFVEIQWVYVSSVGEWPERQIEDFLVKQLAGAEEEAAAEQNIDEEDE